MKIVKLEIDENSVLTGIDAVALKHRSLLKHTLIILKVQ